MDLQTLWFVLIVVLWSGYFLLEGFDFGVGMLLPFVPRNESERGAMFESIGPVWDGNEVWLVVAGAATFAAFPAWYATMFSGFYLALLLLLFFLIVRVVSFEWRSKSESPRWRAVWLWANAIGSTGIALVWGIALANLIHGVPINSNGDYDGNLVDLFTGYTVFAGIAFVLLFAFHGASYLTLRTTGALYDRVRSTARRLAVPATAVGAAFLIWTVVVAVDRNDKDVFPVVLPAAAGIAVLAVAAFLIYAGRYGLAFAMTALGTVATVATLFTGLYPRVMVSSTDFSNSLDVSGAASQHYTLAVMTLVALIVLPIVLVYQSWSYYVFRARVTGADVQPPKTFAPPDRWLDGRLTMPFLDQRLVRRARPVRHLLVLDAVLGALSAGLVLVQAVLIARVVAQAFSGASLADVTFDLVLLALAFAGRSILTWGFEVAGRRAASTVLSELRLELVERRLRKQPLALDGAETGEIAATAVQGVEGLEAYFARYLPQVVLAIVVPVAVLGLVVAIDPISAGLMLLTLPLVPVFMWLIGRHTEERTRERWLALRLLSTHFLDVVRGLPTLRAFNRGRAQAEVLDRIGERYRRTTIGTLRVAFISGAVLELAATLGVALVAVTAGVRLVDGGLGLQAALTVLVLAPELYLPVRQLAAQFHASADGIAVAERMMELLDEPPAAHSGKLVASSPLDAPVRFEAVSFAYPSRPALVLDGLDLELHSDETVALIGPSGSGKTTVASLLLRFVDPVHGRISVGGLDLAHCRADLWREQLAWVPQQPTIFRGTIADNIRLGDPGATARSVRDAAVLAGADRFVQALPFGYETLVGDGGRPLSAGESRRIALARAFVRNAPLVILDEPTADLDRTSAGVVAEAVERLRSGRMVLLIAHRPELVAHADRVVLLEDGKGRTPVRDEVV